MFGFLAEFDKIVVTGPQRSGTRICAKMIAHDLGRRYVSEAWVGINVKGLLLEMLETQTDFVVQCPGLCRHVHELPGEGVAVVLMRRDVADIIRSQERIRWGRRAEERELKQYRKMWLAKPPIAKVKYRFWDSHQKSRILNAFEVEYERLSGHPLWIPRERRGDFTAGQTEAGKGEEPYGPSETRLAARIAKEFLDRKRSKA